MDTTPNAPLPAPPTRSDAFPIGGIVLIVLGVLFLANNFIPGLEFHLLWPVILIVIGAMILWKHRRPSAGGTNT